MNEQEIFSLNAECVSKPSNGKFTIGNTYYLEYNRMNDIVWYTCKDDEYKSIPFHESSWTKYFNKI